LRNLAYRLVLQMIPISPMLRNFFLFYIEIAIASYAEIIYLLKHLKVYSIQFPL